MSDESAMNRVRRLQAEIDEIKRTHAADVEVMVAGIPKRIRDMREAAGITQEELAKAAHLSRQSIVNIEAGRFRMTIDKLMRIAKHLGTTPNDILGFKP